MASLAIDLWREAGVGNALRGHMYNDQHLSTKEATSSAFDYSGAYAFSTMIESK